MSDISDELEVLLKSTVVCRGIWCCGEISVDIVVGSGDEVLRRITAKLRCATLELRAIEGFVYWLTFVRLYSGYMCVDGE